MPVDAIDLEYIVRHISELLGGSWNTGFGSVSLFRRMDEQTRRGLFELLTKLERSRRENVINWNFVFRDLHKDIPTAKEDHTNRG